MKNIAVAAFALLTALTAAADAKPRLFVLTDLANEPDDEESLVRLLAYANEFDIEGIAATTSCHLRQNPRSAEVRRRGRRRAVAWIAASGEVDKKRRSATAVGLDLGRREHASTGAQ